MVLYSSIKNIQQFKLADAVSYYLSAYVRLNGDLSLILQDRLNTGLAVYSAGYVPKIIIIRITDTKITMRCKP